MKVNSVNSFNNNKKREDKILDSLTNEGKALVYKKESVNCGELRYIGTALIFQYPLYRQENPSFGRGY